ncbi:MAG: hypothetical protein ABWZ76_12990 [Acidimicrobiales bacterium]
MATLNTTPLTPLRVLGRGLFRRCPLCGSGACFETFFLVKERCPRCNFPLRREEGHWIGAIGMNTIVTFGLLMLTLVIVFAATWEDRSAALVFIPSFAVAGLTPILFFGSSQTLWSAIHLLMTPPEPSDDIDVRWLPPRRARRW